MRRAWNRDIVSRGRQQEGGRIWFGGQRLKDGTLNKFNEECTFPCKDLSGLSAYSADNAIYTYNFDNIDIISQKTDRLPAPQLTSVSTGTLRPTKSHWQQPRKISTSRRWNFGLGDRCTHLKTWRNSMVSSFTHVWSYPWGKCTSQSSNGCWGFSTIVLSYHAPALRDFEQTWSGGSANFNSPSSRGQSLSLFPSTMLKPFWM